MHCAHVGVKEVFVQVFGCAVLVCSGLAAAQPGDVDLYRLRFVPAPVADQSPALTPPPTAVPEAPREPVNRAGNSISDYVESIRRAEETLGPWAEAIAEDALALASLYRNSGRQREALAALEQALQVTRVNKGLFDAAQIPIVRQIIDLHIQLEEFEEARRREQYLFYVQRKNYRGRDPRLLSALIEWADWNVNMHLRERALGQAEAYIQRAPLQAGPPLIAPRLQNARDLYHAALNWLHDSDLDDTRVVGTERKLAALNYLVDQELTSERQGEFGAPMDGFHSPDARHAWSYQFQEGSAALKRALAWSYKSTRQEYRSIAERMMELGDWYLLFDHRAEALQAYEEALAVLSANAMSEQEIERIMTPGLPVPIPEVERHSKPPIDTYKGYIDVEFKLSRFGLAYSPVVIDASPNSPKAVKRELLNTIRDCKFRPKLARAGEGRQGGDDTVKLRYYYTW